MTVTLAEYAILVDAEPKWVLNARLVLGHALRYTLPVAERLALARRLQLTLHSPLTIAWEMAGNALRAEGNPVRLAVTADDAISVEIDLFRLRADFNVRRAFVETMHAPRRAGRPARRSRNPVRSAEQHGLDLSLLKANLNRTPAQRLRQLDGMVAFRQRVRRKSA